MPYVFLQRSVEESLERLGVDYIDVIQVEEALISGGTGDTGGTSEINKDRRNKVF